MDNNLLAEYEAKARKRFNLSLPEICTYLGNINDVDYLAFCISKRGNFGLPVFIAIQPNGEMSEITDLDLIISLHKGTKKSLQ